MIKFLDLTYYNNRNYIFPKYLIPSNEGNISRVQDFYSKLSVSSYGKEVFRLFYRDNDEELIKLIISKHGLFFEKFLALEFRHRFHNFFKSEEKSYELLKQCKEYYNSDISRTSLIYNIKNDFLKICLFQQKNEADYNELIKSVEKKSVFLECEVCKNTFQPIKLPDWVYYGSNGNDSICYECPINEEVDRDKLSFLISELVNEIGFIPNADLNPINYNFSSRVEKSSWVNACKILFKMGIRGDDTLHSDSIFKQKFGSWFKTLIYSNVLPNNILESSRGVRCIAMSGNECNSLDEMFIDNWFFKNGINTLKEPLYPKHNLYNKSGRRRADWKVGNYFIEYFGLKGEETYDKKTKEKILLAESLDLKLISIFPSDLNNISVKLKPILK